MLSCASCPDGLGGLGGRDPRSDGSYRELPFAGCQLLYDSGFYVSVVNAMLVHGYGNNSLRRVKTDKKAQSN